MDRRIVVFSSSPLRARGGGPSTYLWNLRMGICRLGTEIGNLVAFAVPETVERSDRVMTRIRMSAARFARWGVAMFPELWWEAYSAYVKHKVARRVERLVVLYREVLRHSTFVHAHSVLDAYTLRRLVHIPMILTVHTPEPLDKEIGYLLERRYGSASEKLLRWIAHAEREAFQMAYALFYPSKEATEAHLTALPWLEEVFSNKKVYFILTGVPAMKRYPSAEKLREQLGVGDAIFVLYVGRYNTIKGFDLYIEIFRRLQGHPFVFGSLGRGDIQAPKAPGFIDLGWVDDPSPFMSAADLLVLPSRMSYFDLVGLEAMSLGLPILASAVGGNKTLAQYSRGVVLFKSGDADAGARALLDVAQAGRSWLRELGVANARAYQDHFTLEKFAKRYLDAVLEVLNVQNG